jgi:RHS repeat-associated protein
MTKTIFMPNYEFVVDAFGNESCIIYLCNGSIAVYDETANTKTLYHGYYDAQGSLIALTDNSGNVLARYAYDPWGKRVAAINWNYSPTYTPTLNIDRGYTMHEHLDEFGLINMNGRVYDPAVAQFLSPDPYIQDAGNWLNYNRYAYCYNNPMRYVDPDGEFAISAFLLNVVVSVVIDYGTQVAFNHQLGLRGKDAWVSHVDFFDIAVSGAIGGITSGFGASLKAGESIGRFGSWFIRNPKFVQLGGLILTSAIDITGNGFQNVESEKFGSRMLIGGMTWTASNMISGISFQNGVVDDSQKLTNQSELGIRTTPKNLSEQLTLEEAQSGLGERIMKNRIKDPNRLHLHKMYHTHEDYYGNMIEIHYWFDPETGLRSDFKFKDY